MVDDVIAGCGTQAGKQGACIARMALLDAGWSTRTQGFSVERFCGSALSAVNLGAMGALYRVCRTWWWQLTTAQSQMDNHFLPAFFFLLFSGSCKREILRR